MEEIESCLIKKARPKCQHGKDNYRCKLCKGSSICEHNKEKYICFECNGKGICEHNKQKRQCKLCIGASICEHNKNKSNCKICKGSSICEHNKQKCRCRICNPSCICQHNILKCRCKICNPKLLCIHTILKNQCIECNPTLLCFHSKRKPYCLLCIGSQLCEHGKRKSRCYDCCGKDLCKSCKLINPSKKYDGHCLRCFIHLFPDKPVTRNYKTKESSVATFVTENFSNFTWNIDKTIQDGCSRRRPDLICDLGYQIIIVEIDENQHNKYDCSCENKRIMELSQDVGHRPIVFIRFNPDDYIDASNKNITSCWGLTPKTGILKIRDIKQTEWNNRLNTLKQQIEYWCNEDNKIEKTIEIIQLFYDEIDNNNNIEEK